MATSQLHTAPLKERIAALQGKVSGAPTEDAPVASRSHSPLPNAGGSSSSGGSSVPGAASLSRTGTVRDKAARFEQKGGMPVPRGAFGMSLPPEHVVKEVRRGELWGNRLPELGRGTVTASHSRNVSASYSDVSFGGDEDDRLSSHSRSASPLPGQNTGLGGRRRTASSSFAGGSSFRRMSQASGGYDRDLRFSASNPDFADSRVGEPSDIPPVPPLPPSVVEARSPHLPPGEAANTTREDLGALTPTMAPLAEAEDVTTAASPSAAKNAAAPIPPITEDVTLPLPDTASPVPALRVEVVDSLDAAPHAGSTRISNTSSLPAQSDQEDEPESPLFYVPPGKGRGIPLSGESVSTLSSRRSPPPPSLNFSNWGSADSSLAEPHTSLSVSEPATPSDVLTPSTIDAFPTPPTLSPQASPRKYSDSQRRAPSPVGLPPAPPPSGPLPPPPFAARNQSTSVSSRDSIVTAAKRGYETSNAVTPDDSDEVPPPPPPKDDILTHGRRNERGTRKSSVDSSRASETSHASTLPITPPATLNGGATTAKKTAAAASRKPLVVPNWWEDDQDEPTTTGWVRVAARQ